MPHQSSQAYISPDQPAGTSAAKAEAAASRKNAEACAPGEATVMAEAAPEAGDGAGDAERAAGAASAKSEASSAAETGCARTGASATAATGTAGTGAGCEAGNTGIDSSGIRNDTGTDNNR